MDGPNDRWGTVRSALTSWSQTMRLCLILLIIGISQSRTMRLCLIFLIIGIPVHAATWMILR